MKKILLTLSILALVHVSFSQLWKDYLPQKKDANYSLYDYQNAFKAYCDNYKLTHQKTTFDQDPENKEFGIPGYSQFKRWEWYWEPRVNQKTGEFPKKSAWEVWQDYKNKNNVKSTGGTWVSRGAANLDAYDSGASQESGTGRLNCAHFDPSDDNHYWVGAPAGGLWETTDNGANWTCLTDNNPVLGVSDIAIPPDYDKTSNPTIYIASGDRDAGDDPSIGVLKTTDGGSTWTQTGLDFHDKSGVKIGRLIINPDDKNIMWAATSLGIYRSANQGTDWTFVQGGNFIDMELLPGSTGSGSGTLVATTYGWGPKVYRTTDGGLTWTNTWTAPSADEFRCDVAVTPAASNNVYIITANGNSGNGMAFYALYMSTDGGATFGAATYSGSTNNLYGWNASNNVSDGGQGWYDATLAVSNTNANVIYIGGVNAFVSTNGGSSFTICNGWRSGLGCDVVHADHHNAYFRASDNRLFDCNDGGFYYSDDVTSGGSSHWTPKINGIVTGQLYDIGVAQTVANEIVAGYQDNGTKLLDPDVSATDWHIVKDGDGMCCAIDPTTEQTQWGTYAATQVDRTTNEWGSSSSIRSGGNAAWAGPVEADPRDANTVYVGSAYVERYIGTSKTNLSASLDATDYLRALDVYNDGSNLVIWTASLSGCWKSNTSGGSYTAVSGLPGDAVTDIAIDKDDYNHVYVCFGGYDNYNVYETTNGGTSWTDISEGLPAVPCGAIVINEANTTKNEVYVGTDAGIYVKLGNAPWQLFNDGMPFVSITDLEIYYGGASPVIYASTYGRGVWSSDCYDPPTLDASISYISVPSDEYCSLGNITPTVKLGNIGTTTLTSADINYTIDGGAPVSQHWTGSLAQGATTNIVFPSITLTYGTHDFSATVSNPNGGTDSNTNNDSRSKTFNVWNNDVPYTQSFDNFTPAIGYNGDAVVLEECWTNDTGESSLDWSVTQGETPSGSTGPSGDHTSGNGRYLYTEVSGISSATSVRLLSPTFDLTNYTNNQISFWYCMNGANCGSLQIDLFYNGSWHNGISAVWDGTTATSVSGNKGASWLQVTADISAADGYNDVQIRISSTTGTAYDGDIAIDDFNISGISACTQPATQATNLTFSSITNNSITASWTSGSGDAELVVVREGSAVNQDPSSGSTYTANTAFGSGQQIGTGNYVVYDGTAGTVTVTGLTSGQTYYFAVYTYNAADHCYNITELAGNTTTLGPPTVTTTAVAGITDNSANSGGNVTSDNGSSVTARGVCWNTSGSPTTSDNKTSDGTGTGTFTSSLTGLSSSTTYHVRAYATNAYGTSYGNEETFTTLCGIFTLPFTEDFSSGALPNCWENIDNDGGGQIWQFNNPGGRTISTTSNANGFAILDSDNYGSGNSQDADLVTPTLDLSGYTGVNLYFEHYFKSYSGSSAELFYSIDGGNTWTSIQSWTSDTGNPETFNQAIPAVDGQANVKFKWNYTGTYGWYWAVDDINITGTATCTYPSTQASAFTATPSTTSINIGWTRGNGDAVLVVARDGSAVNADPTDGNTYTANAAFGSGSQIGTGNYVVYDGTGTSVNVTGLTSGNTYYFAIYEYSSTGNCYLTPALTGNSTTTVVTYNWTGNTNSDWQTTSNWSSGVIPTSSDDVTIPNGRPNYPVINNGIGTIAQCNNITIESSASVTIDPDGYMTVNGSITNNAGNAGLVINSDATGTGSLIQNTSSGVDATVNCYFDATSRQWHLIASPVSAAPFTVLPSTNNLYAYDESTADYWTGTNYDNGSISGWTAPSGNMTVGKGYAFNYYLNTITYNGQLNPSSSTSSLSVPYTDNGVNAPNGASYDDFDGWTLLGNPYTSAIDWDNAAVAHAAANLNDAIYCYDDKTAHTYTSYVGGTGTNGGTQYIPAMQGFFVKSDNTETGGTLDIGAAARVHNAQGYWKTNYSTPENFIRLKISANGYTDETVVRMLPEATLNMDNGKDAYKLFTMDTNVPQIYTRTNTSTDYSINTIEPIETGNVSIPLKVIQTGDNFTIDITEFNFNEINVYLKDNLTGTKKPLLLGESINFNSDNTDPNNRFELIFEKSVSKVNNYNPETVMIYPNPNKGMFNFKINNANKDYKIELTNISGKIVWLTKSNQSLLRVDLSKLSQGIYFAKIYLNDNIQINKKIVIE